MNLKSLVKFSNIIGLMSIGLLVYWLFAFILMTVFGLKIFRENLTEIFTFSVLGILVMMAGSLMLNIMLNLTRIADSQQSSISENNVKQKSNKLLLGLLALFPLLAGILFTGDYLTVQKKKSILLDAVATMQKEYQPLLNNFSNYSFNLNYINQVSDGISLIEKNQVDFHQMLVIVPDKVDNMPVYLKFDNDISHTITIEKSTDNIPTETVSTDTIVQKHANGSTTLIKKADFIHAVDPETKQYLDRVFANNSQEIYFSAHDGYYKLYYPYHVNGKTLAVWFITDYQSYGKIGS